jgi:hypothetical protein
MNTANNDEDNGDNDMTWKVVRSRKPSIPLLKAKHHAQGETMGSSGDPSKRRNGSDNDNGGFKARVTSGTVEVRFLIYPTKRSSFNLCMRLREFITEAQSMDSSFRIMPLEDEGGEYIEQSEDWPNTKERIDKLNITSIYDHTTGQARTYTTINFQTIQ